MPKGIPLIGDRSVWDAEGYPEKHANDIDTADGIHHTLGGASYQVASGIHNHDANYSPLGHTHVEADITDLDHDAEKIDGIVVNLSGIADGQVLVYDVGSNEIVPGEGGGGGYDEHAFHDNEDSEFYALDEVTSPSYGDLAVIEYWAASYAKRKIKLENLGMGGAGGGGAPTDATYVVTSANGTLSAEIIRPQLAQYFRETPPTSANAKDDEFDDESFDTGKWTQSGTFTTLSETSLPGYLYMDINGGASNAQAYIYQTPPSLPFTIEIKAHALFKANFSLGGIYIYQDGSNEAIFGFIHNSRLRWWGKALGSDRYDISRYVNNYDTGPAFIRVTTPSSIPGTYTVEYSNHGLLWQTVYSGSLNLTPSRIGIALHPNSGSYAKFLVEYFRVS